MSRCWIYFSNHSKQSMGVHPGCLLFFSTLGLFLYYFYPSMPVTLAISHLQQNYLSIELHCSISFQFCRKYVEIQCETCFRVLKECCVLYFRILCQQNYLSIQQSSQHHNNVQHVLLNSHNSNDLNGSAQQHVQISSQQSMHLHVSLQIFFSIQYHSFQNCYLSF